MTVGHHPNPKLEESSRYREPMPDSQWQALWNKLARELRELNGNLVERLVEQLQENIEWLDGHMTRYCEITCAGLHRSLLPGAKYLLQSG